MITTPKLLWNYFVTQGKNNFSSFLQQVKTQKDGREFEIRFGCPIKSKYDGIYNFNSNIGKNLFDKYKDLLDIVATPKKIEQKITRKSIEFPDKTTGTIRMIDDTYNVKKNVDKIDNLVSINSETNLSVNEKRNLFYVRFSLAEEKTISKEEYDKLKSPISNINRRRFQYDFGDYLVDLTLDVDNENSMSYSLELEYKNEFLNSLDKDQTESIIEVLKPFKNLMTILFPDVTEIKEYNTYKEILSTAWKFRPTDVAYPKILPRPKNIARSDVPLLHSGYIFTNKLNGVYFRLVISEYMNEISAYLINDLEVIPISTNNPKLRPFNNTIIDIEYFKKQLWAFDCPVYKGRNNTMLTIEQRIQPLILDQKQISKLLGVEFKFNVKNFTSTNQDLQQGLKQILTYMYDTFGETIEKDNDGIIMSPTGSYQHIDKNGKLKNFVKSYYELYYPTFKWKFPSTVSIDFLIKQSDTYSKGDVTYKVFNLYVQDSNNLVKMGSFYSNELKREFIPPEVYICNSTHEHYNSLSDEKIIEVVYNKESNSFELYHIRTEKTRPNSLKTANDTFVDMALEFSLQEFNKLLGEPVTKLENTDKSVKYVFQNKSVGVPDISSAITKDEQKGSGDEHCLTQYRKYHNSVKRKLIENFEVLNLGKGKGKGLKGKTVPVLGVEGKTVLDLGTGKGGDLLKYKNAKIKFLWAVEPYKEFIVNSEDGLYSRISNIWNSNNYLIYDNLKNYNVKPEVPIMVINTGAEDQKTIYDAMLKTHKLYNPDPSNDMRTCDVITSFFSMTFFFQSSEKLDLLVETISQSLKVGGHFIGTVMDGEKTYNSLKINNGVINYPGCYTITSKYGDKPLGYNNEIGITLPGVATVQGEQTEWLVDFALLEEKLKYKYIKLQRKFDLDRYDEFNLSLEQKLLSNLFIGFVFEKLTKTEMQNELSLKMLTFKENASGNYIEDKIYKEKVTRTGSNDDGSCFFSSLLMCIVGDDMIQLASKDEFQFFTHQLRKIIGDRVTFKMYTNIKTTESTLKLIEAVKMKTKKGNKEKYNSIDKVLENLSSIYYGMVVSNVSDYHQKIKAELITEFQKVNPDKDAKVIISRWDEDNFKKYISNIIESNIWANDNMFDVIGIIMEMNIFIIKDATKSIRQGMLCELLNKKNPCILLINIGTEEGKHFEPLNITSPDGSKKFIFKFTDDIIQNCYKIMCTLTLPAVDISYYPPNTMKQFEILMKTDPERLSSLVFKSTNCKLQDYFPYEDDLELLLKFRDCKTKSSAVDFTKIRQSARLRDINFMLNQIKPQINSYLDFGGSDGAISSVIAKSLKIDKEKAFSADIAKWFSRPIEKRYSNLTYVEIIPDKPLSIPDNSINFVTCFQVLHHIENVEFAIKDLYRVMTTGGIIVIREHNCENDTDRMLCDVEHALYEVSMEENPDLTFHNTYYAWYKSQLQWRTIMEANGFKFININYPDIKSQQTKYYYESYKKL